MDEKQKNLKKEWKAAQKGAARAAFPLANSELAQMFEAVEAQLDLATCDHSLKHTEKWLNQNGHNTTQVLAWLADNGGHCDCEVFNNVQQYWEENGGTA